MKTTILTVLTAMACATTHAQIVTDTVSIGAGYAQQTWYSLPNDEQGNAAKTNWDIAFDVTGFGSTVLINSVIGTTLWAYPNATIAGWSTVDTTGLSTWPARYNADTSWSYGAMGKYADPANPNDVDWGIYNMTTHQIAGDSLYIIKLANGDFKKLAIVSLIGGIYTFQYANLDGSGAHTATLDKSVYTGKNFGYYSLQTNAALDREPAAANWDILFTQYTSFIPQPYSVSGVLSNKGVQVAKCANVIGKDTFVTWSGASFYKEMNTIGYNWKSFTGTSYSIQDSLVYFVARTNGEIWKMIFTGFSGSSTGSYIFSKERLSFPSSVPNVSVSGISLAVYPNPAHETVNLIYNITASVEATGLRICDMTGKVVLTDQLTGEKGLHQYLFSAHSLQSGMYLVTLSTTHGIAQQQLIIR